MTKNDAPASAGRSLLGRHLAGFSRWLEERGYAASTVEQYRVIAGRFDRYLTDHAIDIGHLNEEHLKAYLKQIEPRRPNGRKAVVAEYYRSAGRRLVEYLREQGVAAAPAQTAPGPTILRDYLAFLSDHRALALTSIAEHERWLLRFFAHLGLEGEPVELRELSLSQIDGFLIATTTGLKRAYGRRQVEEGYADMCVRLYAAFCATCTCGACSLGTFGSRSRPRGCTPSRAFPKRSTGRT